MSVIVITTASLNKSQTMLIMSFTEFSRLISMSYIYNSPFPPPTPLLNICRLVPKLLGRSSQEAKFSMNVHEECPYCWPERLFPWAQAWKEPEGPFEMMAVAVRSIFYCYGMCQLNRAATDFHISPYFLLSLPGLQLCLIISLSLVSWRCIIYSWHLNDMEWCCHRDIYTELFLLLQKDAFADTIIILTKQFW